MPEAKSVYDIYFGAEADPGAYEASKFGIQDIWSGIEHRGKLTEIRLEEITNITDSLMAAVELGDTLYQGAVSRKEFKADLETVQTAKAKEAFKAVEFEEGKEMKFSEYIKSDVGKEWYGGFRSEAVGSPGLFGKKGGTEAWEDLKWWEKLGQERMYKFGEEDSSVLTGAQVEATALSSSYGMATDWDAFRKRFNVESRYEQEFDYGVEVVGEEEKSPSLGKEAEMSTTALTSKDYSMLSKMLTGFQEKGHDPKLGEDLKHFQPWLDQMAKSRGWTGTRWS